MSMKTVGKLHVPIEYKLFTTPRDLEHGIYPGIQISTVISVELWAIP